MDAAAANDGPNPDEAVTANNAPKPNPAQPTSGQFSAQPLAAAKGAGGVPNIDAGLPPVLPPSGRFIAQLFVVPGMIILVLVVLFLVSNYFVSREHDPTQFLAKLDSDNADIRKRAMSDLAQILKRREPAALRWKADPKFALDLAERLDFTFQRMLREEKELALQVADTDDADKKLRWRPLHHDRDYISFLAAALGEFHAPVGAPIVCAILQHDKSPDLGGNTLQRRRAMLAMANMGDNAREFAKMPADQQRDLIAGLKSEAAGANERRAGWARTALYYLDKSALPGGNVQGIVKVDDSLALAAESEDRLLRELTALSLNFWDGDKTEATLLKLAKDDGRGTMLDVKEDD